LPHAFEIICLGNELLIGKILNSNAHWLAKNVTSLGGTVQRITVVGDDIEEIATVIREALARKSVFILTTGGLGPTYDDKTLDAVGLALEKPVELNEAALLMVKEKYRHYEQTTNKTIELTPARLKMAHLPKDAVPLPNPVGTSPGVLSEFASSTIINLPGVPSEMKAIFEASVAPLIRRFVGSRHLYEKSLEVTEIIESALAPLIDQVMREHPTVYVKSHPQAAEPVPLIELHLSTLASSQEEAKDRVEAAAIEVSRLIEECGGVLKPLDA
jgi:molybdenum cofactor synthesis domain-containing protein